MWNVISRYFLLLIGLLLFIGCGGQPDSDEPASTQTPSTLVFSTQPTNPHPLISEITPVIEIQKNGQTVTTGADASASITLSLVSGSGTLTGTVTINAVNGVADFTGQSVVLSAIGDKTIRATKADTSGSEDGSPSATADSSSFEVTNGPGSFTIAGIQGGTDTTSDAYLTNGSNAHVLWSSSVNAVSYDVTIRDSGDTSDICATVNTATTDHDFSSCGLSEGTTYLAKVTAIDSLTNTTDASNNSFSFTVDTIAPSAPTVSGSTPTSPADSVTPTVDGTSEANANINIYSDSGCSTLEATGTANGAGAFNVALSISSQNVAVSYYANATDAAGNISACSSTFVTYTSYSIPVGVGHFTGTQTTAASSPTNLNQTTESLQWSGGEFDSDHYSHSTSTNSHQITVTSGGNYLVSLTLPLTSTAQRAAIHSEFRINGATYAPGTVGDSSYIRNSSGHSESSNNVSMLMTGLSANDIIDVTVERNGISGTATVTSQATLTIERIDSSRPIFAATGTQTTAASSPTNFNQSAESILWETELTKDSGFTHSTSTNAHLVSLDSAGEYLISVNIPLNGSITRGNVRMEVLADGARIPGFIASQGYIRNTSGHNNSSLHFIGVATGLSASTDVSVTVAQEGAGGTMTVQSGKVASLFIERLPTTNNLYSARGSQLIGPDTNFNSTSLNYVEWTTDDSIDISRFTHNTSTDPHQITVGASGDYFVMYNAAITGSATRANPRVSIEVNGTPVTGAESMSNYIRNGSGHNEASTSLGFLLRKLTNGDVIRIGNQQEGGGGTTTLVEEANLSILYKANK